MQIAVPKTKPTIHQAKYHLVRQLAAQMEPLSKLVASGGDTDQLDPTGTMVTLLQQIVGGIDQIHARLENLEARLDDPAVVKAIKSTMRC